MSEITLVRQETLVISDADKDAARRVLFGIVDGLGEVNRRAWRRFVNGLLRMEPGEMAEISTKRSRLGWYHRKHMAMEQTIFEAQEKFEDFNAFRNWLKVGAGHVDWYAGPRGGVIPVPKSISYRKLEQGEMEKFHADVVAFLRTEHASRTLWPKVSDQYRSIAMESLLGEFNE